MRNEPRDDGTIEFTLLQLDPMGELPIQRLICSATGHDAEVLLDGAPAYDARGLPDLPEGFWPARRVAGGWLALIDDSAVPAGARPH